MQCVVYETLTQELVKQGQAILREYGIDPILAEEVLTWAPNGIPGQHSVEPLREVVEGLVERAECAADYDDIADFLEEMGAIASSR
ncbi:hypothetical protein [Butyrivibrio sp. INlla21]|uniref:hypothetical protein n=1 Tax=Butyrivibrio sp. INlla21 TaxID=1520811 RepID=UPI000B846DB9|nr:hypothetical protein [Butyrivibrio sp. INlla21]